MLLNLVIRVEAPYKLLTGTMSLVVLVLNSAVDIDTLTVVVLVMDWQ